MTRFRVAAVQMDLSKSLPSEVKDMIRYMQRAKRRGVDIVCFPECSLIAGPKKNAAMISRIKEACKNNKIWCITGGHLREKKYVYNTALLINDQGEVCGKHKKVHICDSPHISAGQTFDIFETPFCKIGIAICWDITFPGAIDMMAKRGAKVVFCPMWWGFEKWEYKRNHKKMEKKILKSLILTRAYENLIYVVFCGVFDPKDPTTISYSAIAEPHKIVKEISGREGMIFADVDLNYLEEMRKRYDREFSKRISR